MTTYKIIGDEPTEEMIRAVGDLVREYTREDVRELFAAMWKAAPEVKQEPVGYWNGRETVIFCHEGPLPNAEYNIPLFTFPPDAQAEIAKRDARIVELEKEIDAVKQVEFPKRIKNVTTAINARHSHEIDRLKSVIEKCELALDNCGQGRPSDDQDDGTYCNPEMVDEALAAIKEVK